MGVSEDAGMRGKAGDASDCVVLFTRQARTLLFRSFPRPHSGNRSSDAHDPRPMADDRFAFGKVSGDTTGALLSVVSRNFTLDIETASLG